MTSQALAILGMHRSGTSCLMATLQRAGLSVGRVTKQNEGNPLGNQELISVWRLHERMLKANGGSWDNPPERVVWRWRDRVARDAIIWRHFRQESLWGFKDPRLLFTLGGWFEKIPHLELIGAFRHPLAVAASLARRDAMSQDSAIRLWCRYNKQLLRIYDEQGPFPVLSFDLPDGEYAIHLDRVLRSVGLESDTGAFDPSLRHHVCSSERPVPKEAEDIYLRLLSLAGLR